MLIIVGGLPGTGKTTIARELARSIDAVHVRIDTIEHALRESGTLNGNMDDAGYRIAYAVAEDNLRVGRTVIADSVNPNAITREAWRNVARRSSVDAIEIEFACSDDGEHRSRVETRTADINGFMLPTWEDVVTRDYERWEDPDLIIDTALVSVVGAVARIQNELERRGWSKR